MDAATLFGIFGVIANTLWPLIKKRKYLLTGQIAACAKKWCRRLDEGKL
jgi:hypothetical protein